MDKYIIEGGYPIKGSLVLSGNKNAALPCIAASVLTEEPITLRNIPEIEDVLVMFDVLRNLGGVVEQIDAHTWRIDSRNISNYEVPEELAKKVRASILFAGPLTARFGKAILPPPGGDTIGRRRIDTHILALQELGARISLESRLTFSAPKLVGLPVFLDEASVTGTENAVMAAVLAEGTTVLMNAACEPHVQDLCRMLIQMGADIEGVGSNRLIIHGGKSLRGTDFTISADYMELGSFIGLAAVTGGDLQIEGVHQEDLPPLKVGFSKLGVTWKLEGTALKPNTMGKLCVVPDIGGQIPKIDDAPWPGFPADLTSIMTVVATQAEGVALIHEKMFESRMFFVDKLISMGARIVLCDPHRAIVYGPSKLVGNVLVSPDVRAGMAMVIAALCAKGTSIIHNVYQIERGYERLVERLSAVGARIRREED
ncbi:MAG TPA: UDP-N-acetylglucosamine 1-carboxyvinyltransferase [Spirochaetaceae bacterium]|nr:UDP-N-acetylglucosamine 1-carboxyvinyltransferase [Spirochaetaceae bacterium]